MTGEHGEEPSEESDLGVLTEEVIYTSNNSEFIRHTKENFNPNYSNDKNNIEGNLQSLSKLPDQAINFGISRTKSIEVHVEQGGVLVFILGFATAIIASYLNLIEEALGNGPLGSLTNIVLTVVFLVALIKIIKGVREDKSHVVFLRSLLEEALKEKEDQQK